MDISASRPPWRVRAPCSLSLHGGQGLYMPLCVPWSIRCGRPWSVSWLRDVTWVVETSSDKHKLQRRELQHARRVRLGMPRVHALATSPESGAACLMASPRLFAVGARACTADCPHAGSPRTHADRPVMIIRVHLGRRHGRRRRGDT